jgi:hypothetical protein
MKSRNSSVWLWTTDRTVQVIVRAGTICFSLLLIVQTGSGTHVTSCSMEPVLLPWWWSCCGLQLITHWPPVLWSRFSCPGDEAAAACSWSLTSTQDQVQEWLRCTSTKIHLRGTFINQLKKGKSYHYLLYIWQVSLMDPAVLCAVCTMYRM